MLCHICRQPRFKCNIYILLTYTCKLCWVELLSLSQNKSVTYISGILCMKKELGIEFNRVS